MNKVKLTTIEIITIIITTIVFLYGLYFISFTTDIESGKILLFISLISFSYMLYKKGAFRS
jgi:hypothetical protein